MIKGEPEDKDDDDNDDDEDQECDPSIDDCSEPEHDYSHARKAFMIIGYTAWFRSFSPNLISFMPLAVSFTRILRGNNVPPFRFEWITNIWANYVGWVTSVITFALWGWLVRDGIRHLNDDDDDDNLLLMAGSSAHEPKVGATSCYTNGFGTWVCTAPDS